MLNYQLPEPRFEKLFRMEVLLDEAWPLGDIGTGYSEIVAVKGGTFSGTINGSIVDFGGDWGLLHSDCINVLDAKYLLKTDDEELISTACKGYLMMDMETMEKGRNGEFIPPSDYYFRVNVQFTTGADKYKWLNSVVAFAVTMITPEGNVCLDVYQLK